MRWWGFSSKPERDSYQVAAYLRRHGYRIMPVNPRNTGTGRARLLCQQLRDVPVPVDIVDVFRESNAVPDIVTDTIAIGAKISWLQLGIHHPSRRGARTGRRNYRNQRSVPSESPRLPPAIKNYYPTVLHSVLSEGNFYFDYF
jgi:predicted CoA-binding protein